MIFPDITGLFDSFDELILLVGLPLIFFALVHTLCCNINDFWRSF